MVSSNAKARRAYVRDIQRNTVHSAGRSFKNVTKFNRQTNIAYISIHAVPDLYSSFESVVYIHTGPARWTDIGVERLFGHIYGICVREFVGENHMWPFAETVHD